MNGKNNTFLIIYYAVMMAILMTWTDSDNLPPMSYRLVYLFAVLTPIVVSQSIYFPHILTALITVSLLSFAKSYMLSDGLYILGCCVLMYLLNKPKFKTHIVYPKAVIILLLVTGLSDFIFSFKIQPLQCFLLIILFFCRYLDYRDSHVIKYLSLTFIIISLVLSLEFLLFGKNFVGSVLVGSEVVDRLGWFDPNYFSCVLGLGVIASFIELYTRNTITTIEKIIFLSTIISSILVQVITASRGAVLALGVSGILFLVYTKIGVAKKIGLICASIALFVFLLYNNYTDLLYGRIITDDGTGSNRFLIWGNKLNYFFDKANIVNYFFGIGSIEGLSIGENNVLSGTHGFHSDYVAYLVDYGFVGLMSFLFMLYYPVKKCLYNKPYVVIGTIYLIIVCLTLEPLSQGQLVFLFFYQYLWTVSQVKTPRYYQK